MASLIGLPLIRSESSSIAAKLGTAASVSPILGVERTAGGDAIRFCCRRRRLSALCGGDEKQGSWKPIQALEETKAAAYGNAVAEAGLANGCATVAAGTIARPMSIDVESSNIVWHKCSVGKHHREELLNQRGCVIWITGLSGSGKSTLACALSQSLHCRGKLTYVLDGDNVRHGLNRDLSFKAEDRAENIRRIGEVAKLFADAGVICIASLISPYQKDRDACRALLPKGDFIEVYMDVPLQVCEARDPKGLYKLARAGKIKGFTGLDDPYEQPVNCEVILRYIPGICTSPTEMAEKVVSYLDDHGYLQS